ncbi:hypothetical protein [Alkaliphilus transvaalensis]|uniref:hypothetical protein n=1 Tax=Alkaliphilus transvaalensis TaxID=114628 RepID=UPI00047A09A0|nr:hypothetical protein [Alkaliphilus transvaalensis]
MSVISFAINISSISINIKVNKDLNMMQGRVLSLFNKESLLNQVTRDQEIYLANYHRLNC